MTDWIQSIATIILGAATIALFWVTKTLAHSTDRLARISGQDFRAKHSPRHKDTPAIEGVNIVLKGAIRPFPGSPPMTLIYIVAESSVEITGAAVAPYWASCPGSVGSANPIGFASINATTLKILMASTMPGFSCAWPTVFPWSSTTGRKRFG